MVDWFGGLTAGNASDYAKQGQFQDRSQILGIVNSGINGVTNRAAPQAGQSQIATGPQDQFRNLQLQQANQLAGIASGQQMGAGELAARRAGQQAIAGQQSLAHAIRGNNAGSAQLGAARNIAQIGGNIAGQAQQAAFQDQQGANAQLTSALGGARGTDVGLAQGQAQLNQQAQLANLDAQLRQAGLNDQARLGYLQQLTGMDASQLQAQIQAYQTAKSSPGVAGSLLNAGGQILGSILSDERQKTNIADASHEVDQMLDALKPQSYEYRDPKFGEGRRAGIMAQDLARTPAGARVVHETEHGLALDVNKALSAALASSARLNERVRKLEAGAR